MQFDYTKVAKLAIVATENGKIKKRPTPPCSPSLSPTRQTANDERNPNPTSIPSSQISGIMPPSAPFLTWSPILLPPWGPALFPAALYPAALRSLPGFVDYVP